MKSPTKTLRFGVPLLATAAVALNMVSADAYARSCGNAGYMMGPGHHGHAYGKPHYYPRPMGHAYGQAMRPAYPQRYSKPAKPAGKAQAKYGSAKRPDIVETAKAAGNFNTLLAAVKAAGLVDTLKGDGPLTVFAPTDEAFAKLPKEKLDALLQDKEALAKVLTYHVVPARLSATEIKVLTSARTAQGQSIAIDTTDGVRINSAKVVKADVQTRNGVIHAIDTVLLPNDAA